MHNKKMVRKYRVVVLRSMINYLWCEKATSEVASLFVASLSFEALRLRYGVTQPQKMEF